MSVFVDLSGTGIGAQRQYALLRQARPKLFARSEGASDHVIYWQCFTRNWELLEARKRQGKKIIVRVGGFHSQNEETTRRLLKEADAAIFVCEWLKEHLKDLSWRLPAKRTVIRNGSTWVGWRESDVDYLLIRCAQIGAVEFRRGLNRAYSVWAMAQIWDELRDRYPSLNLLLIGKYKRKTKAEYALPGWKWLGFDSNSRWYGQGAIALVHLVPGDYSPNSVAEAIGEGCPIIVPSVGGAHELAGDAGATVGFGRTEKRRFPEAECGGHFYQIDKKSLLEAVCDVIDNRLQWRIRVGNWWEKTVNIQRVADRWEKFLDWV